MARRFLLAPLLALVAASTGAIDALANGRPPQTSSLTFRPGAENEIAAGTSFGLLLSKDNGATWRWMCEDALPYGGMYDPDYEIMNSGTLFATTFDGLKVNRDGCVFAETVLAPPQPDLKFFSVTARASDNTFYAASADPKDGTIYKSTNEGTSFTPITSPGMLNDWWQSLEVAPSDTQRLYLSGYRFVMVPDAGTRKDFLLFSSANGGTSWTPLSLTGVTTMSNSTIEVAGISKTNPDLVYIRVTLEDNAIADGIYRSTNGGMSWTKILSKQGGIALVVRANGDLFAGTQNQGSYKSTDMGASWTPVPSAPHINCLTENAAGEVWACTQNYGNPQIPTDGYGIMKSTDLTNWTPILKYQDIYEPVTCPSDTLQYTKCDKPAATTGPLGWCGLCEQLGCDPKRNCAAEVDGVPPPSKSGCCEANAAHPVGGLVFASLIGIVLLRRRRRR